MYSKVKEMTENNENKSYRKKLYRHIPMWAVMKRYTGLSQEERSKRFWKDYKIPFPQDSIQARCLWSTGDIVEDENEAKRRILEGEAYQIFLKEEQHRKYEYQEKRIEEILDRLENKG